MEGQQYTPISGKPLSFFIDFMNSEGQSNMESSLNDAMINSGGTQPPMSERMEAIRSHYENNMKMNSERQREEISRKLNFDSETQANNEECNEINNASSQNDDYSRVKASTTDNPPELSQMRFESVTKMLYLKKFLLKIISLNYIIKKFFLYIINK